MTLFVCSFNRAHAESLEVLAASTMAAAIDFADARLIDATDHAVDVRVRWPAEDRLPDEVWRVERLDGQTLARLVAVKTRRVERLIDVAYADNVGL